MEIETALHIANTAAGFVVGKLGTATVGIGELAKASPLALIEALQPALGV